MLSGTYTVYGWLISGTFEEHSVEYFYNISRQSWTWLMSVNASQILRITWDKSRVIQEKRGSEKNIAIMKTILFLAYNC